MGLHVILESHYRITIRQVLVGLLYRPPDKLDNIENLNNSLEESNISNTQECYLIGDFNVDLLSGNKMLLKKQYFDYYRQAPSMIKNYIDLCFSHSLHQLIKEPSRATEQTKTLIDHILTNSREKVIQSRVIEMGLSKTILDMQNFHIRKLLIIRKNFTLRKKSQKIRTIPKNSGEL